jgi:hypothetical protein
MINMPGFRYTLLVLLFIGVLVPHLTQAQADFRLGYVVQLAGDTLRGEVGYSGAQRSARVCRFRPAPSAPAVSYNAGQLRGYGFPGSKVYEARLVTRPDSAGYVLPPRPIFMEVLVAGPLTLYYYLNGKGQDQYYIASARTGPVQELVHNTEVTDATGHNNYYRENNRFRGTLAEAFAACPLVQQTVSSLVFKLSTLTAAVQRYNDCVRPSAAPTVLTAVTRRRSRVSLGVLLGGEISRMELHDETTPAAGTLPAAASLAAGLGLQLSLPLLNERLALRLETLYEQQHYDADITNNTAYTYDGARVRASAAYLRVPVLLRYTFPTKSVQPFLQVGVNNAFLLSHTQELQYIYSLSGSPAYTSSRPVVATVRSHELSPVLSLGLQLPSVAGRPLALEGRAERSGGIFATSTPDNYVLRYFLLVSYALTQTN